MSINLFYDIFDTHVIKNVEWCGKFGFPKLKPCMARPRALLSYDHKNDPVDRSKTFLSFYNFDKRFLRVLKYPEEYRNEFSEFEGLIGLDCSQYEDLPMAQQIFHVYCNRVSDAFWQQNGIDVVPNVSWANYDSFPWCCDGVAPESTIAVSSVGTIKCPRNRMNFLDGFFRMVKILHPNVVVYHGTVLSEIERCARENRFDLLAFKSRNAKAYETEAR